MITVAILREEKRRVKVRHVEAISSPHSDFKSCTYKYFPTRGHSSASLIMTVGDWQRCLCLSPIPRQGGRQGLTGPQMRSDPS